MKNNIPQHIAIIMDGNGRWAKKRNLPRVAGHKAGVETLRDVIERGGDLGVKHMTFYAFSTENWKRPEDEVKGLMNLLVAYLKSETKKLHENNIKINVIGDTSRLPKLAQNELKKSIDLTANNTSMTVHIALNYGARDEIVRAVKRISTDVKNGQLDVENIDDALISNNLYTAGTPDPDLMIRTSGEVRLSNFLLWQFAYTEFVFTDMYWPDFNGDALENAIEEYQNRHRRFGKL
ncbi:isoprenyl transferase [Fusibacter sp. JL216-2]|uniref:isoprenyl transferase n=1 Tax=Fusibacter sp. JL216-2 TaxID=3071453 RepID=UPI003D331D4F